MVWKKMMFEEFRDGCARQSLVCKWHDFSYFCVFVLLEAFHQVSTREDILFGRRCWLKNSKMAV